MNALLLRYLKKLHFTIEGVPTDSESWKSFLSMISRAFDEGDADRRMMEHSLDKSSLEMTTLYENLKTESEKLRQSQKMEAIGSLAGGVAHDFNNLLAIIFCYSDLILSKLHESDPLVTNLKAILHAANRGSDLTRQLLAFSRQQVLQPKVLEPGQIIEHMSGLLSRLIGESIQLDIEVSNDLNRIMADQGQVEQVIMNLVVNAKDAISLNGRITVRAYNGEMDLITASNHLGSRPCPTGPGIFIDISDTGTGISKETQQRMFEPFFTTKGLGKGTGLGLATVLGITEQSHGGIFIESVVGTGTTFRIFFPKIILSATAEEDSRKAQNPESLEGSGTILVVEDEKELLEIVTEILETKGYSILKANSPQEALKIMLDQPVKVDLLLTDVVMPEMGGGMLAQTLQNERPSLKVLFMSGYTDDAVLKHGVQTSKVAFIQKPFASKDLLRKVKATLGEAQIQA